MADGVELMREWYGGVDGHDLDRVWRRARPTVRSLLPA